MQTTIAFCDPAHGRRRPPKPMLRPTPTAVSGQLQPDPPQWLGGRFRAQQDRHRHDQAFLAVNGGQGAGARASWSNR